MSVRLLPLPLLLTLWLPGCSSPESAQDALPQPVRIISAGADSQAGDIRATGLVGSQEEARLGFKTGGLISSIRVEAGSQVRPGQVLASLDTTELDAQVRQADENLAKAKRDLARAEQLFGLAVIAEQAVQDARTQLALAEAARTAAGFNRRHAVITAPASGVVLQRLAEPRELVAAGAPVLVVSRDDLGWVLRVGLDARAATEVRVGDRADVRLDAYPDRRIGSSVREVGAASDPRTGTVSATLSLPPIEGLRYIAGQVGEARIARRQAAGSALTVPVGAILEGHGEQASLYVIGKDDKTVLRQVRVGRLQDERIEVLAGLEAGERVVSEGAAWLSPGEPVRILP